jgi:hypothetical protein
MACPAAEAVEEEPVEVPILEPGAAVTVMQRADPAEEAAQVARQGAVAAVVLAQELLLESSSISIQRRLLSPIFYPIGLFWVQEETAARAETGEPEAKAG